MSNNFHTPAEAMEVNMTAGVHKANLPFGKMFLLGFLAGVFIAFGAASSSAAMYGIGIPSLSRVVGGIVFPVGLMMVVFMGGELFTGNCLVTMVVLDKKVTVWQMIIHLIVSFLSNMLGALTVAVLIYMSGQYDMGGNQLGGFTISVAVQKASITFEKGIASGILCNTLVCVAILIAAAAKDIAGKIWGIFFPVWAFFVAGYEHCIANFYYIPAGILAANNKNYAEAAYEFYGVSPEKIAELHIWDLWTNIVPVTIGNVIGGVLFVGITLYIIHRRDWKWKHKRSIDAFAEMMGNVSDMEALEEGVEEDEK